MPKLRLKQAALQAKFCMNTVKIVLCAKRIKPLQTAGALC